MQECLPELSLMSQTSDDSEWEKPGGKRKKQRQPSRSPAKLPAPESPIEEVQNDLHHITVRTWVTHAFIHLPCCRLAVVPISD